MIRRSTTGVVVLAGVLAAAVTVFTEQAKPSAALSNPAALKETAPATFTANFDTSAGSFVITVHRDWAPNGADRFYNLVKNGFFTNVRFFRAIPNFMVQFGIHGDPAVASQWRNARLAVDKVVKSNTRGMVTYAMGGTPDTRTTQMFINFKNNANLDAHGLCAVRRSDDGHGRRRQDLHGLRRRRAARAGPGAGPRPGRRECLPDEGLPEDGLHQVGDHR